MRLYIYEVGFVAGIVVRRSGQFLGVQFELQPSIERDLLIRKLFRAGMQASGVKTSAWAATAALLASIWTARSARAAEPQHNPAAPVSDTLPAVSLAVAPSAAAPNLQALGAARRVA